MPQKEFQHKIYIFEGKEYHETKTERTYIKKEFPIFESLISFLYLDITEYDQQFNKCGKYIEKLYQEKNRAYAVHVGAFLQDMAWLHPYFEITYQIWNSRLEEAEKQNYKHIVDLLPRKELTQIPSRVSQFQKQIIWIFENAFDLDLKKGSMQECLVKYYKKYQDKPLQRFPFRSLPLDFEIVENKTFTEVLYPENLYDIVDFFLRECIKREQPIRRCKNCQKYFAIHGRTDTEYCSRPIDDLGRTCRDLGASYVWERKKKEDEVFRVYRREYKKRFAWIKAKKIDADEFYAWSERAREKKAKCDRGEISLEEFKEWLKK